MHPSRFDRCEPITEDDATIEAALKDAHVPSLMAALVHLTGDPSVIRGDIRPSRAFATFLADPPGGITAEQQATIRARALAALKSYRDGGRLLAPAPSEDVVHEMMSFMIGQPVPIRAPTSRSLRA